MANDYDGRAAIGLVLNLNENMILQKKDGGYVWHPYKWCLFGGQIEEGEEPEEALLREFREELSIEIDNIHFFKRYPHIDITPDNKRKRTIDSYAFGADFIGKIGDIRLSEGSGFAFYAPHEITTLDMVLKDQETAIEYLKSLNKL